MSRTREEHPIKRLGIGTLIKQNALRGHSRLGSHLAKIGKSAGLLAFGLLAGCSSFQFGPTINTRNVGDSQQVANLPAAAGQTIGTGPVRVAMLLPLTGDLASVGNSMANGARMAMSFIEKSPQVSSNITIVLKDTAGNASTASQRASEAVSEGASLILGPLRADAVRAAGSVASSAGIPEIGFSNNSSAASPGVYLLNVLPEAEVRRSVGYAKSQGRTSFAAVFPTTEYGRIQENAFRQAVSELGVNAQAVFSFSNETEARSAVEQVLQMVQSGSVDAIYLPDRATAPSFGVMLESSQVDRARLTIIGSADWDGDQAIMSTPSLVGAVYPAVDPAGMDALRPEYQAAFGSEPHPFTSIAYTATLLANSSSLTQSTPRYDRAQLTRASGFNGRDGLFRFLQDGRSEYALIMKQVGLGVSQQVDGPRLP